MAVNLNVKNAILNLEMSDDFQMNYSKHWNKLINISYLTSKPYRKINL
jgi:hypothetical protein